MQKTVSCLSVLISLCCNEYQPSLDGSGGTAATAPSTAGGSKAVGSAARPEGGTVHTSTTLTAAGTGGSEASLSDAGSVAGNTTGGTNAASSANGEAGSAAGAANGLGGSSAEAGSTQAIGAGASSLASAGAPASSDFDCGLPEVGRVGAPKPSGAVGGLKVIDWAGFEAAVSFTFDDGCASQLQHYAALESLDVRYTFFLIGSHASSNIPEWQQAVADGHELGNHTQYHRYNDPAGSDVAAGKLAIASTYGVETYTMAAPYGNDYASIAANHHFLSRGVSNGLMLPNSDSEAFNTPCFIPDLGAKAEAFDAEVGVAREGHGWKVILVHGFTGDDSAYNPVDIDQFTLAVQNAKAPGDLWIDTFANVGAYWRGQAAFSRAQVTTSGNEQIWSWALPEHFPPGKCLRVTLDGGTLQQNGKALPWNDQGYYEISLDAGSLTLVP